MAERCPSCDHLIAHHAPDRSGCLFEIKSVPVAHDRICPCVWSPPPPLRQERDDARAELAESRASAQGLVDRLISQVRRLEAIADARTEALIQTQTRWDEARTELADERAVSAELHRQLSEVELENARRYAAERDQAAAAQTAAQTAHNAAQVSAPELGPADDNPSPADPVPTAAYRLQVIEWQPDAIYAAVLPTTHDVRDVDGYGIKASPAAWKLLLKAAGCPAGGNRCQEEVCDCFDFYESDESVADVVAAFDRGEKGTTGLPSLPGRRVRLQQARAHHARTSHGHPCCVRYRRSGPVPAVALCGGPAECEECSDDVDDIHRQTSTDERALVSNRWAEDWSSTEDAATADTRPEHDGDADA